MLLNLAFHKRRERAFFLVTRHQLDESDVIKRLEKFKTKAVGAREALRGLSKAKVRPDKYNDELDYGVMHNHLAMQHSDRVMKKIAAIKPGTGPMSYRRLHPTRFSNTLFSGHRAPPAHFKEPRSITVREAARLQGSKRAPNLWLFFQSNGTSNQRSAASPRKSSFAGPR